MRRSRATRVGVIAVLALAPFGGSLFATSRARGAPAKPATSSKASASVSASATVAGPKPLAETLSGPAKDDYDAAMTAYALKDYGDASIKFRAAYDKAHDPRLLFNLASCEKNLRHYVKMRALLQQYLAEGAALLSQKDHDDAEALIAAVEPFISSLKVVADQTGAQVFVDDELAGETPLPKSVAVDLGSRKVRVHKDGFKDFEATVAVGGDKEAVVEAKHVVEVRGATLKVVAPAGAHISIDNAEVGVAMWQGKLTSGGHTLRVTAPGMLTYQVEVVLQDGVDRTVDVALDPIVVVTPEEPSPDFTFGLRTGYGKLTRNGGAGFLPLWLDVGVFLSRVVSIGFYAQAAKITTGNTCGTAAHGPSANGSADFAVRYSFDNCFSLKPAFEMMIHTRPRSVIDPWFALDFGLMYQRSNARTFDPLGSPGTDHVNTVSLQPGLQLGVDWHALSGYRPFIAGAFVASWLSLAGDDDFNRLKLQTNFGGGGGDHNIKFGAGSGNGTGFTILFGARVALSL